MARARLLKPGFFANEHLAELPAFARLLFAGLWTLADREGRMEDRPKRIKAAIFPYEEVDVDALLDALASRGFVQRYEVAGGRFIFVTSFPAHQHIHPKEPPSVIPAPSGRDTNESGKNREKPDHFQTDPSEALIRSRSLNQKPLAEAEAGCAPEALAVASDAPEPPAESEPEPVSRIARPKRRDLTIAAIAELQAEMPGVDMDAAAADYLNWSGSAKHVDKVQGLRNQLREQWRRDKFKRNGNAPRGEYGIVRAVPEVVAEPDLYEPPDDGQALHRGRVWRAVLQRLGNLDPPLSGQFQHALRGSAWAGQEGNVAIVVTRSAAGAEYLADMAGILAAELRAADPGTVFEDVEVRMPARGGVA